MLSCSRTNARATFLDRSRGGHGWLRLMCRILDESSAVARFVINNGGMRARRGVQFVVRGCDVCVILYLTAKRERSVGPASQSCRHKYVDAARVQ